jgi:tryptophan synthase alpha chain
MPSISETFEKCKQEQRKALMPFITSGYPDNRTFIKLLKEFDRSGADMIEVGIPFSDPMADGKTIQYSSQKALEKNVTLEKTFDMLDRISKLDIPLIAMSYFNPIYAYGITKFMKRAHEVGVRGVIIPDLIPEEGARIEHASRDNMIDLIYLLAPTSSDKRKRLILNKSRGFVYLVSVAGVTGARKSLPPNLSAWIKQVKKDSRLPVSVGFGISNIVQARYVSQVADGVIIGSAIIDIIKSSFDSRKAVNKAGKFIRQLRKGLNHDKS